LAAAVLSSLRMSALWIFLPILGALIVHAPVLRFDLFPSWRRPLDGGATFRGHRIFGDNKTWRGVAAMFSGVVLFAVVLSHVPAYWSKLPGEIQRAGGLTLGALVGLGAVLGELPNSFLKRQIGVEPGRQRRSLGGVALTIFDQGDFVPAVWLFLAPVWIMPWRSAALVFVVVVVIHMIANVVGFALGARKTWL
jgi:hypothetical protein